MPPVRTLPAMQFPLVYDPERESVNDAFFAKYGRFPTATEILSLRWAMRLDAAARDAAPKADDLDDLDDLDVDDGAERFGDG